MYLDISFLRFSLSLEDIPKKYADTEIATIQENKIVHNRPKDGFIQNMITYGIQIVVITTKQKGHITLDR